MSEEIAASRMVKYVAHVLYELDNRIWHAGMIEAVPEVDDIINFYSLDAAVQARYLKVADIVVNNTLNIWLSEIEEGKGEHR